MQPWVAGLDNAGLLKVLDIPHFGRSIQVTIVAKQLLALVHDGYLSIGDQQIPIDASLINKITGLSMVGPDPGKATAQYSSPTQLDECAGLSNVMGYIGMGAGIPQSVDEMGITKLS